MNQEQIEIQEAAIAYALINPDLERIDVDGQLEDLYINSETDLKLIKSAIEEAFYMGAYYFKYKLKWISVEKSGMPDDGEFVNAAAKIGTASCVLGFTIYRMGGYWYNQMSGTPLDYDITHYQYLPLPPTE